jgi:AraC-like DNA-binding protein
MELKDREFLYIISSALLLIIALVVSTRKPERKDRSRLFLILYFWSFFYAVFVTLVVFGYLEMAPHLARTAILVSLLMMPFSYFYVLLNTKPRNLRYSDLLHLVPALIYCIDYLPFFMKSGEEKLAIMQSLSDIQLRLSANEGWFMPEFGHTIIRNLQVVGYCVAQTILVGQAVRKPGHPVVFDNPVLITWMKVLIGSQFVFFLFPMIALVIWGTTTAAAFSNLGPLLVSVVQTYFLVYEPRVLYGTSQYFSRTAAVAESPDMPVEQLEEEYEISPELLSNEQMNEVGRVLEQHMASSRAYLRAGYKLIDLSQETGLPVYKISFYVNRSKGVNFFGYLNKYRIEHCLEKFASGEHKSKTLEALAEECGFQSRTTFIRAFKQYTGLTPSEYISGLP